ncbi:tyrosine-type recombinase/integrase (plasmid) [Levilactobacillus brevis]|uniref:tyrosine-type recombinase/integrase n=1 Tax=Levilactobacillus brevis TaxID=1580 RepID=UPI002165E3F7|nr:tyrosine-type recombinase/integrase [Levilactobacillus brevis]UVW19827.1 tyrosine-type recombinase/integrase [Levilactobacillus brevis]
MVKQTVLPIKDSNVLNEVKDTLLNSFTYGRRNYTVFQVGKATLLRVSDVLALKYDDVFASDGRVQSHVLIHDKKTGKPNELYLEPVSDDLKVYYNWLESNGIHSEWLFPSLKKQKIGTDTHINERQFYRIMQRVGDLLGIDYLGTHTMRKTGAYMVYQQSGHDIALVMDLLNHSSQKMTLKYLGLDRETKERKLRRVNFD